MSHLICPHCRLRFTAQAAIYLLICPECDAPAAWEDDPQRVLGLQLFDPRDLTDLVEPDKSRR